jgi:hypothetical protein
MNIQGIITHIGPQTLQEDDYSKDHFLVLSLSVSTFN